MAQATDGDDSSRVVARFEIRRVAYLDGEGKVLAPLPEFARDTQCLVGVYRAMVLTRSFDAKAVALQRTGRLGTYPSSLGQEAVAVGVGAAMQTDDILLPSFREQGTQLWRGVTPVEVLLFWGGDERGSNFAGPREDFPVSIPVAGHAPHAAGAALALKLRGEPQAVVCVVGDGATSKGDFYEALNIAGVWKLPAVFVVNNNCWAISVPRRAQTAAATLAQKALAAGVEGVQVDGNDVIAVRDAVGSALERARAGSGAALVECETYRLSDHTTADDASRYRDAVEVSARWKGEPVARLRSYLVSQGAWTKQDEQALLVECARTVDRAVAEYLAYPPAPATDMFDDLFETLPRSLLPERRALAGEEEGDA